MTNTIFFAHEFGHALGWEDVYAEIRNPTDGTVIRQLSNAKMRQDWLPSDWNNGPGPAYYSNRLSHAQMIGQRLMMFGHGSGGDAAIVIPRGQVWGLHMTETQPRLMNVGLSNITRPNPIHR